MEDAPPSSSSSSTTYLTSLHRQVHDLDARLHQTHPHEDSDESQDLLKHCARFLLSTVDKLVSDCSNIDHLEDKDLEAYVGRLEEELSSVEAESARVSDEYEGLVRTHEDDWNRLSADIEQLKCSLEFIGSQDPEKAKLGADVDWRAHGKYELDTMNVNEEKFKLLELENQVDKNHIMLKSLQDLEYKLKWLDATEQFEDAFSGIKVLSYEENCIRLSLRTYIPQSKGLSRKIVENTTYVDHELLIELEEGTMDLRSAEIFPNEVCIKGILDAAKSLSKSSLQWFVTKVQDKIVQQHGSRIRK